MSWSYKIILLYVVFITGMLIMVYVASRQTNEMQEDNYYAKELKYQEVIDGKNNLNAIAEKLSITNSNNELILKIPAVTISNIKNGTVFFLRPSDQSKDIHLPLEVNEKGEQHIPLNNFVSGLYTVKISWKNNGTVYFSEQNFNVRK
jgi:nitrogen fixation protein FixH